MIDAKDETMAELEAAAGIYSAETKRHDEARARRDAAILAAAAAGNDRTQIAKVAGMSRGMVYKVLGALVVAILTLSACGGDEPATGAVAERTTAPAPSVTETTSGPVVTEAAELGDAATVTDGVTVLAVASSVAGSYAVQFEATPSFAGSWVASVTQFSGRTAGGETLPVLSSQWPENPTISASASIMGGTLTFAAPITEIIYTADDGSTISWSVT